MHCRVAGINSNMHSDIFIKFLENNAWLFNDLSNLSWIAIKSVESNKRSSDAWLSCVKDFPRFLWFSKFDTPSTIPFLISFPMAGFHWRSFSIQRRKSARYASTDFFICFPALTCSTIASPSVSPSMNAESKPLSSMYFSTALSIANKTCNSEAVMIPNVLFDWSSTAIQLLLLRHILYSKFCRRMLRDSGCIACSQVLHFLFSHAYRDLDQLIMVSQVCCSYCNCCLLWIRNSLVYWFWMTVALVEKLLVILSTDFCRGWWSSVTFVSTRIQRINLFICTLFIVDNH